MARVRDKKHGRSKTDKAKNDTGLLSGRPIRRGFSDVGGLTRHTAQSMKELLFSRIEEDREVVDAHPDDQERFYRVLRDEYGLDEAGIERVHTRTFWHTFFWLVTTITIFAVFAYLVSSGYSMPPFGAYTVLAPLPACAAMIIKNAFLNWQARERRLSAFYQWAKRPSLWLPSLPEREENQA